MDQRKLFPALANLTRSVVAPDFFSPVIQHCWFQYLTFQPSFDTVGSRPWLHAVPGSGSLSHSVLEGGILLEFFGASHEDKKLYNVVKTISSPCSCSSSPSPPSSPLPFHLSSPFPIPSPFSFLVPSCSKGSRKSFMTLTFK
jgi:hypothetical protein